MRIAVRLGPDTETIEVRPDLTEVQVGERVFPVKVLENGYGRVELEVAGERVVVEEWSARSPPPPKVVVNGERFPLTLEVLDSGPASSARPAAPRAAEDRSTAAGPSASGGTAIVPPMPGRVVELKVREGEQVTKGQVLLVLEAMKMRNEVATPRDGIVRRLTVATGANVRAREPMLWIEAE